MKPLKVVAGSQVEALRKSLVKEPSGRLQHAEQERPQMVAIERTALLLGSFRRSDADDPEIFGRALEHVLSRYDPEIQTEVTEPGRFPFPPSAYELRQACEAIAGERGRARRREEQLVRQLEERRRLDALQAGRKALTHRTQGAAPAGDTRAADLERRKALPGGGGGLDGACGDPERVRNGPGHVGHVTGDRHGSVALPAVTRRRPCGASTW